MMLKGKRVLVRIDANVPLSRGAVIDGPHGKIARAAVDLEWLRQQGARIIVLTHLGRPQGRRVPAYTVRPVAKRLSELLGAKIPLISNATSEKAKLAVERMKDGEILMLENVRFHPGEKKDDKAFAKKLASLADIYVNDAFAVSHRAHASLHAIAKEIPSYAGPLVANEIAVLSKALRHPKSPFVLFIGGLKMKTKLPVLKKLLPKIDQVYVGGALATAFHVAEGYDMGKSVYEKEAVPIAKELLKKWRKKIVLPSDVFVVKSFRKNAIARISSPRELKSNEMVADVGPCFLKEARRTIEEAKTIIWNGPLGYCEVERFCKGSITLAKEIAKRTGKATTIVGGGDTVPIVESSEVADKFTLLSTGGGALLAFLAEEPLPGLENLLK